MGSWPDFPKLQKPEGITDWEWTVYQNSDIRTVDPHLRDKVERALGWKDNDVADAREIAARFAGVVSEIDQEAAKGHVPEENLFQYRRLRKVGELFGTLGSRLSGLGFYEEANAAWSEEAKYQRMANELRADLPEKDES